MCDKQKIYMCTQTFCNNTLNFKGKQNDDIQAKGCFLATELLTSFFLLSKMSENLCKLHRDLDKYYSQNYLSSWCGQVKIGKKHMPLKKLDPFILVFKSYWLYYYYLILFPIEWTEFLDRAFRSIIPTILGEPNDNRTCLDIGCGPSISNVISGRSKIQIYFFILQSEKNLYFLVYLYNYGSPTIVY